MTRAMFSIWNALEPTDFSYVQFYNIYVYVLHQRIRSFALSCKALQQGLGHV